MTGAHGDIGPELRKLAQMILDRVDPALRAAAAGMAAEPKGSCQQVWCPVCALAALVNGEQHPMLAVISEHSLALLAIIRAMTGAAEPSDDGTEPPQPPAPDNPAGTPRGDDAEAGPGRYQTIPVVVEE